MRTSGILMPVSSLPSPYGIGSLGAEAYRFVDFLAAAGQRYWQILPIGPTGYGDSPYQSFSAFAANPYFIDLDALEQRGLLTHDEIARFDFGLTRPKASTTAPCSARALPCWSWPCAALMPGRTHSAISAPPTRSGWTITRCSWL
ncbi:MAG: 4-alpha-glucanotransferase [Ruthenibacterium lactatiformans]